MKKICGKVSVVSFANAEHRAKEDSGFHVPVVPPARLGGDVWPLYIPYTAAVDYLSAAVLRTP